MSLVLLLQFVHVVAAMIAVGANVTYVFWQRAAGRDPERLVYTLRTVRRLDNLVATPAYIVVLVAGLAMVWTGSYSLTAGWISASIGLFVLIIVFGMVFYAPALKRQLTEAERDPASPAYADAARRATIYGMATLAIVIVIVFLMVTKPF